MDFNKEASNLRKKLEKAIWQLDNNPDLSKAKHKKLQDEVDDIRQKLKDFEDKLTPLGVTKLVTETHKR